MSATTELRSYLGTFAARCRAARWLGALFHVGVVSDIAAEVAETTEAAARISYTAEQEDREAAKLLRGVLADGKVTPDEIPALKRAARLVNASAEHGRAAHTMLTA